MRWSPVILLAISACTVMPEGEPVPPAEGAADPATQEVSVYRACDFAAPGELIPLPRTVPAGLEPPAAAIGELLAGVTASERDRGCRSYFSSRTADALRSVDRTPGGDTIFVDFRDFSDAIPDAPGARSFLPPGVMAELTWTIFHQFPDVEAVHFSFEGDERAFWRWVGGEDAEAEAFTRRMWERI